MIGNFKPYVAYKDSGSHSLGRVPEHWRVQALRTLITARSERNQPELPLLSVARERGVFVRNLNGDDDNHNVIPEDLSNYKVARKGDLVINKMKAWQGSMGIAPCDGLVSPAYFVYRLRIANRTYGQALLRSRPYVAEFGRSSDGVRIGQWDLSVPAMRSIRVLLPPVDEQDAIVRFLDHATARTGRAIRAKLKLIALLEEQRQVIIQDAVMHGINPDACLGDNGPAWVGEFPSHWDIQRGKLLMREIDERSTTGEEELLSVSHITGVTPRSQKNVTMFKAESYIGHKLCQPNDLVVNTMWAWMGALGTSNYLGIVSPSYAVYRLLNRAPLVPGYLNLLLRTPKYVSSFRARSIGIRSSRLRLYPDEFLTTPVILPPMREQSAIVRYVSAATAKLQAAIERARREVELLREYRTRLAADVVVGKFDVSAVAAALPDIASADLDIVGAFDGSDIELADDHVEEVDL